MPSRKKYQSEKKSLHYSPPWWTGLARSAEFDKIAVRRDL
jgi:hypothetical protein